MRLFGRRSTAVAGGIVPVNNGIAIHEIEVEKVILTSGRDLIGDVVQRLREKAAERDPWNAGFNMYDSIRRSAYSDMADELYTIAARPWFEECP